MTEAISDELTALVKGILANLEATGVLALADWLDENDAPHYDGKKSRGQLLRRRAGTWQKNRRNAIVVTTMFCAKMEQQTRRPVSALSFNAKLRQEERGADAGMSHYIRARFQPRKKPKPPAPHTCQRPRSCCCSMSADEPDDRCPIHGGGEWPPKCGTCGRIMPYTREGLAPC